MMLSIAETIRDIRILALNGDQDSPLRAA